jgi:hypothetical protein
MGPPGDGVRGEDAKDANAEKTVEGEKREKNTENARNPGTGRGTEGPAGHGKPCL